ncbi:hypothetical protein RLO149_c008970 [Roseobacter litoralis Och 149]|uniref:Uncharacterized protein n=1 Tax=Roseobacter litoralis (strain ATCC 49566 / DSM 6996 / JCM 21268 / NBRC 15278 / OCh 149) TaxID=391595 RepID=F7Z9W1_ROSLO|nr:hypothetical protein RLO149_c008970 [Roseobacter litoralis Och 149]
MRLNEAENLLSHFHEMLLHNQIYEALAAGRICDNCRKRLVIHNDRGCTCGTLYGRFRVKAPRLR